jgi:Rad3-related DNA helicase
MYPERTPVTTTLDALHNLLAAQGRTARSGQVEAAKAIDAGDRHVALCAPTGVGKSALAIAASLAAGGGIIGMHSNGLVAQYAAEIPEWEEATGASIVTLVGKGHYWCKSASPDLAGLTVAQKAHVVETGTFIGAGLEQKAYKAHTVLSLSVEKDEDDDDSFKTPCDECPFKASSCPLWQARNDAAEADIVITNATMLGLALGGGVKWAASIVKPVIVLDEAHADVDPIAEVLGSQITIKGEDGAAASAGLAEALSVVFDWADDDTHPNVKKARRFLAHRKLAAAEGRKVAFSADEFKVVLTIPVDLTAVFAPHRVIAMSATLSDRNVKALGLDATVKNLEGLDVSASTVFVDTTAPAWKFGKYNPAEHKAWAKYTAAKVTKAFRNGGATLALFVSKDDLNAVVAQLPADVARAALHYYAGTDRTKAIEIYKADPKNHLIVGCVSGAGTGVNLPGDLLRTVIVSRVPQNAPKNSDYAKWVEDTRAAVIQSVGRGHRFDGDWSHVHILGGFGSRNDVRKGLDDLGWVIK